MATLSSPTLSNLVTSVRTVLKQQDPTNSFWKDDEIRMYLNEGIRQYFVEVVHTNEGLFTTRTDLNIVSGADLVALPTDCFEVKVLYKKVTNGYVALDYVNNLNQDYSSTTSSSSNTFFPSYYFQGNNIMLRPVPNFSETSGLRLEYIQFPETLVNGGDSLTSQISPIFKQVVEMYAVYKCKLSESLVNGVSVHEVAASNLAELYKSFKDAIALRSKNPTYVQPFNPDQF